MSIAVDFWTKPRYELQMSAEAIRQVLKELESLPDSDQHLVLRFLASLRDQRSTTTKEDRNASRFLELSGRLLVFTGSVTGPEIDWLEVSRIERDKEIADLALGSTR